MESHKQFDYQKAFNSIDDWNYGYIDKKNLKSFLKKHQHIATNEELTSIIRRMDLDADARLTKEEFIEGIKPEEPYSKMMKRQSSKHKRNHTPKFNHTRKQSQASNRFAYQPEELLMLSEKQRDTIRV